MRTQEEILDELTNEAKKYTEFELEQLENNSSRVSFWHYCKKVVAFAIFTLEKMFEQHKIDVDDMIDKTEAGSRYWWMNKISSFQYDKEKEQKLVVQNNVALYPTNDDTKKIIKKIVINENNETLKIKVAKQIGHNYEPLTADELSNFKNYIEEVKMLGVPVEIISNKPDEFKFDIEFTLDKNIFNSEGKLIANSEDIIFNTLNDFIKNYDFNNSLYVIDIIKTLSNINGVKNIIINPTIINEESPERKFDIKLDECPAGYGIVSNKSKLEYVFG